MSLDDRQNIVIARLNSLNEAVTKAKTARLQKEVPAPPDGRRDGRHAGRGHVPGDRAEQHIQELKQQIARLGSEKASLRQRLQEASAGAEDQRQIEADVPLQSETEQGPARRSARLRAGARPRNTARASLDERSARRWTSTGRASTTTSWSARPTATARSTKRCCSARTNCGCRATAARTTCARSTRAEVPGGAHHAEPAATWLLSLVLGLVLGVGVAYALDYMNDTIKTPDDVTAAPEAAVPRAGARGARRQGIRCCLVARCRTISASRSGRCARR